MSAAFVPFAFIGLVIAFVFLTRFAAKRASANLCRVAQGLDLTVLGDNTGFFQNPPRAEGVWRGKRIELYSYATGSGKSRTLWCAISAAPKTDGGLAFSFRRQGIGTKLMEVFGAHEIEVGDPIFDRTWFVQTNHPDFLKSALLPEIRERINSFGLSRRARSVQIQLQSGSVRYAEQGSFSDDALADRVGRACEVVCDLADIAEVFASEDRRITEDLKRREAPPADHVPGR